MVMDGDSTLRRARTRVGGGPTGDGAPTGRRRRRGGCAGRELVVAAGDGGRGAAAARALSRPRAAPGRRAGSWSLRRCHGRHPIDRHLLVDVGSGNAGDQAPLALSAAVTPPEAQGVPGQGQGGFRRPQGGLQPPPRRQARSGPGPGSGPAPGATRNPARYRQGPRARSSPTTPARTPSPTSCRARRTSSQVRTVSGSSLTVDTPPGGRVVQGRRDAIHPRRRQRRQRRRPDPRVGGGGRTRHPATRVLSGRHRPGEPLAQPSPAAPLPGRGRRAGERKGGPEAEARGRTGREGRGEAPSTSARSATKRRTSASTSRGRVRLGDRGGVRGHVGQGAADALLRWLCWRFPHSSEDPCRRTSASVIPVCRSTVPCR